MTVRGMVAIVQLFRSSTVSKSEASEVLVIQDASTDALHYYLRQYKRRDDEKSARIVAAIRHELMERLEL